MITVVRAGPLTTVQDLGRPGFAHLGVPRSGALDYGALRLANSLVGNPPGCAGLETTLMGCALRFESAVRVAVVGAEALVRVDKVPVPVLVPAAAASGSPSAGAPAPSWFSAISVEVPAGAVLDVGRAKRGVRSYVAVAGGIDVEPVLGSRSTDTLSGLGPPRLADGMTLQIADLGARHGPPPPGWVGPSEAAGYDIFPASSTASAGSSASPGSVASVSSSASVSVGSGASGAGDLVLDVRLGPRDDWFVAAELFASAYSVSPVSNRVGCRLVGAALSRTKVGEMPSEGVVLGAVQVPADGQPLIFLADHPTTGGYPVIGVVADVAPLAQARPGTTVRFRAID